MRPHQAVLDAVAARDVDALSTALDSDPEAARATDDAGRSALMLAVYHRFRDGITMLRARGALRTVHEAAALGDVAALQELAAAEPASLRAESSDGATPLHLAGHFGHAAAVTALVALGADPNQMTGQGFANAPLHATVAGRSLDCARVLLDAGADVNARDRNGYAPLHIAAAGGSAGLVSLLLSHGADPLLAGPDGKTAHALALERDEADAAALLAPPFP